MLIIKGAKDLTIMAIDTSINTLGVAVYKKSKLTYYDLVKPIFDKKKVVDTSQQVKKSKKSIDYVDKSKSMYQQMQKLNILYSPDKIIIEVPEYYGHAAYMSRESGSLFKLTFVAGMLMALPHTFAINPTTWKGQMSKTIVQNRMALNMKKLDIMGMDHNIVDAISIGWWAIHGKV